MRFIIVALALMAMFSTASVNKYAYKGCMHDVSWTRKSDVPITAAGVETCRDACKNTAGKNYFGFECPMHNTQSDENDDRVHCECGETLPNTEDLKDEQHCKVWNSESGDHCKGRNTVSGATGTYFMGSGMYNSAYDINAAPLYGKFCASWGDPHIIQFNGKRFDTMEDGEKKLFKVGDLEIVETQQKITRSNGREVAINVDVYVSHSGVKILEMAAADSDPTILDTSKVNSAEDISSNSEMYWPTHIMPRRFLQKVTFKTNVDPDSEITLFLYRQQYASGDLIHVGVGYRGDIGSVTGLCNIDNDSTLDIPTQVSPEVCVASGTCCYQYSANIALFQGCLTDAEEGCCETSGVDRASRSETCCSFLGDDVKCTANTDCSEGNVCDTDSGLCGPSSGPCCDRESRECLSCQVNVTPTTYCAEFPNEPVCLTCNAGQTYDATAETCTDEDCSGDNCSKDNVNNVMPDGTVIITVEVCPDSADSAVASTEFIEESKQTNNYVILGGIILCTMVGYYIWNQKNKNIGIENSQLLMRREQEL